MRVLVTGGAGFIGSHLIDKLIEDGHQVVCFDNFDYLYDPILKWGNVTHHVNNPSFKLVSGDITDESAIEKAFTLKNKPIDAVVHLAAQAGIRPSIQNPALHFQVNVIGTIHLLECCRKHGVGKFVYASSSSVYGNAGNPPWKEGVDTDQPLCPYAASKKSGELICYNYYNLYKMDISCIRPFTIYGPRQRMEMAVPLFTDQLYKKQILTVYGDGTARRDYTNVHDVVQGIVRILSRDYGYQIYNLGTAKTITVTELIHEIWIRLSNVGYGPSPEFPGIAYSGVGIGEADMTFANIDKAKRMLGYEPKYSIQKGLDEYISWYLNEKKGE